MAYSYDQYMGDGVNNVFAVSFSYLNTSHVAVSVDGVSQDFVWLSEASVRLDATPPNGALVEVRRITPVDERVTDYKDGSTLSEADLDRQTSQLLFIVQEARDSLTNQITLTSNGWDAQNRTLLNLPPATASGQAVEYSQIVGVVDAAAAARDAAVAAEQSAVSAADDAVAAASQFETSFGKVLISADQSAPGFLDDLILTGQGLTKTVNNPGAAETITLSVEPRVAASAALFTAAHFI